ncbi:MAG TPA: hypothetical protein PK263_04220, partial [bacterium]|nr:hypothetical protein [bacterium]
MNEQIHPEALSDERLVDKDKLTQLICAWYRMPSHRHELRIAASEVGVEFPQEDAAVTDTEIENVLAHLESTDDDVLFINSIVYNLSSQPNLDAVYDAMDAWKAVRTWNPSRGPIAHATTELI